MMIGALYLKFCALKLDWFHEYPKVKDEIRLEKLSRSLLAMPTKPRDDTKFAKKKTSKKSPKSKPTLSKYLTDGPSPSRAFGAGHNPLPAEAGRGKVS